MKKFLNTFLTTLNKIIWNPKIIVALMPLLLMLAGWGTKLVDNYISNKNENLWSKNALCIQAPYRIMRYLTETNMKVTTLGCKNGDILIGYYNTNGSSVHKWINSEFKDDALLFSQIQQELSIEPVYPKIKCMWLSNDRKLLFQIVEITQNKCVMTTMDVFSREQTDPIELNSCDVNCNSNGFFIEH